MANEVSRKGPLENRQGETRSESMRERRVPENMQVMQPVTSVVVQSGRCMWLLEANKKRERNGDEKQKERGTLRLDNDEEQMSPVVRRREFLYGLHEKTNLLH